MYTRFENRDMAVANLGISLLMEDDNPRKLAARLANAFLQYALHTRQNEDGSFDVFLTNKLTDEMFRVTKG